MSFLSSCCLLDEGHQLPGLPEVHQHLRAVQQGMDQGEDLRATAPGSRQFRLRLRKLPAEDSAAPSTLHYPRIS